MIEVSEQSRQAEGGDLVLRSTGVGRGLDAAAADLAAGVDGVERVAGLAYADVIVGAIPTFVWGLSADTLFAHELDAGRWFTASEDDDGAAVAVVGPALADLEGIEVGDELRVETGAGARMVQVVGIDSTMVGDGEALFVPTRLVLAATGAESPGEWWVTVDTDDTARIDRIALGVRSVLDDAGYSYDLEARYLTIDAERASDRAVVAVILSLGVPIVAIGMIGVVNTLATTILERRREIGVLRSVGARSRDVRRVFRAEAVVLVVAGWVLGIVVGRVLGGWMMATVNDAFHVEFPLRYPVWPMGVALVVALVIAALALWRPLKRAGELPPGDALRYQ
jgi:putative ABC transport system permease protein